MGHRSPQRSALRPGLPRLLLWTALWVFLLDQITKWLVVHVMDLATRLQIDLLPPVVTLRMAWNSGVNFGLLSGFDLRWLLVVLALVIAAAVVVWIWREGGGRRVQVSGGLLVGGALGNVVDRVLYGAVADFVNFPLFGEALGWLVRTLSFGRLSFEAQYSFNVADIAIFLGAVGLVLFAGGTGAARPRRPARRG
ncbi:signal peptidase II [Rubellimicrobium sp. CFH 75288]|uniref:signal peptidase II n=1 Tax=Rubellimicrobium sp. CFH 75288 TaxID=2697034 RepID=UPI001411E821|nr:signal peptidase II [Rubellimicrobium sp. CFH 75288]NAZ37239.1 signal peptidase II [Rubellimicrobium sp. CFH 75288]